jgi:putative membrane protein
MKRVSQLAAVAGLSLAVMGSAPAPRPGIRADDAAILARFDDMVGADVACAQLASERGHSREVRDFAKSLVSEHGLARQLARDVATVMSITLKPMSDSPRRAEHERVLRALRERPDAAFDVLFLRHEVDYHKELVDLINKEWLAAAKNAELSALLMQVAPAFEGHAKMADELWQRLKPGP